MKTRIQSAQPTNQELSNYLKGLAITTVMAGHFSTRFMSLPFEFYANFFIAFFFVLSGFGIYFSLKPLMEEGTPASLALFFWKRCKRIYPLFWAYLVIDFILDPGASLDDHSIADIFLLHFSDPPVLWFLHAIVACYLFAPLAGLLLKKTGHLFPVLLVAATIAGHILLTSLNVPPVRCWMYKFIYLGVFLLFGLGMYLAMIHKKLSFRANGTGLVLLFLLLIMVCVHTLNLQSMAAGQSKEQLLPAAWQLVFPVSFYILVVLITFLFLRLSARPPLMAVFGTLGLYSYPLYIFEGMYGTGLATAGLISGHSYVNGLVYLLVFPAFLLYCAIIQKLLTIPWRKESFHHWINT